MIILTAEQMRAAEKQAAESGLSYLRMMENAGSAAAGCLTKRFDFAALERVVLLCGSGNNGGDGFVMARKLAEKGVAAGVVLVCGPPRSVSAAEMLDRLRGLSVTVVDATAQPAYARRLIGEATLAVDAVFGTGFHGELPSLAQELFHMVEDRKIPVLAVDLPSGVNADTGAIAQGVLLCDQTVTFHAYKPAHVTYPARQCCGSVTVADIGIEQMAGSPPFVVEEPFVAQRLALRPADGTHKGRFGTAALLVGSEGMAGAALLAARACLRCGAGLVTPIVPRAIYPLVSAAAPEAVYRIIEPDETAGQTAARAAGADAVLAGCGMGDTSFTGAVCRELLASCDAPLVLDADGINSLRRHIDVLKERDAVTVLTPHPGEMARLLKTDVASVQADRMGHAARFAAKYGAVVVLKGAGTVIASPDGRIAICLRGNSGLSKGGSGDVLAGMITSLIAQGGDPFESACVAVWLHGRAGEIASQSLSRRGMLPTDLIETLPSLFLPYEQ